MRLKRFIASERGQTLVLFTMVFVILCFFVGLSIDLSMLYQQRSAMQNALQVVRDDRFTYQDSMRYAENPGRTLYGIVSGTLAANGYGADTELRVYLKEDPPQQHFRHYDVRTEISQDFEWNFMKLFGMNTTKITVHLDGGESYGDGAIENVWHPVQDPSHYNGCYSGRVGGACESHTDTLPGGW